MMKKKIIMCSAVLCVLLTAMFVSGCRNRPSDGDSMIDTVTVVIDLDSIVLRPFLPWNAMLADLESHIEANCSEWQAEDADSLTYDEGTGRWKRVFSSGNMTNTYYFADAKGDSLKHVTYIYYGSMPLEPVVAEVERNGFIKEGDLDFPGLGTKNCYLYLSPSGTLEVQVAGWENGVWCITFQPTDPGDFQYLARKDADGKDSDNLKTP